MCKTWGPVCSLTEWPCSSLRTAVDPGRESGPGPARTAAGSAAPRSWRTNAPKGFMKNDFCFEGVCRYDRIVSTKGDIVITDRVTEKGEPLYEYFEVKKTQRLWNCKDGTMGWRNYKRLKSDQGNWMPWHWGAYRYYTGEPWLDDPHLKRICQAAGITR